MGTRACNGRRISKGLTMRLATLFEREMVGKIPVVHSKGVPFPKGGDDKSYIASGAQARVYLPPSLKNTNSIVKVANIRANNVRNDGYVQFINEVLNRPNNPFFPRIYSAKIYEDKQGRSYFVVVMEKLHPVKRGNLREAAAALFQQLGITLDEIKKFRERQGRDTEIDSDYSVPDLSFDVGRMFANPGFVEYLLKQSNNEYFHEAMNVVEKVTQGSGIRIDLHTENWMVRLTGHGPQLVMIDPVINY